MVDSAGDCVAEEINVRMGLREVASAMADKAGMDRACGLIVGGHLVFLDKRRWDIRIRID